MYQLLNSKFCWPNILTDISHFGASVCGQTFVITHVALTIVSPSHRFYNRSPMFSRYNSHHSYHQTLKVSIAHSTECTSSLSSLQLLLLWTVMPSTTYITEHSNLIINFMHRSACWICICLPNCFLINLLLAPMSI